MFTNVTNFHYLFQLLRSSLVSNRTQATVADEIGLPKYLVKPQLKQKDVITVNDRPPDLKLKEKADLLEGTFVMIQL